MTNSKMSAINDFNKVWIQKFPNSELPAALEEDVKTNLAKHRQKVQELQEDLKKEEIYVQFLESLLEELGKNTLSKEGNSKGISQSNENLNNGAYSQEKNVSDVIKDTLERRSLESGSHLRRGRGEGGEKVNESSSSSVENLEPLEEESGVSSTEKNIQDDEDVYENEEVIAQVRREEAENNNKNFIEDKYDYEEVEEISNSISNEKLNDGKDHFVTVIEVNGFGKEKGNSNQQQPPPQNPTPPTSEKPKKVPPRPPPKSFKRFGSQNNRAPAGQPQLNELSPQGQGPEELSTNNNSNNNKMSSWREKERPVVFDSKIKGVSNANGSNNEGYSNENIINKNVNIFGANLNRKYEGSKVPLPSQQQQQQIVQNEEISEEKVLNTCPEKGLKASYAAAAYLSHIEDQQIIIESKDTNNPIVLSKIRDLVNKMESSQKPPPPNKNIEQLTPKESIRKKSTSRQQTKFHGPPISIPSSSSSSNSRKNSRGNDIVSDYIDPCDVEFELDNEQIYDCPPEDDLSYNSLEGKNFQSQNNKNNKRRQSSEEEPKPREKESPSVSASSTKESSESKIDEDSEPMYDTVAPDQAPEAEDDYVLLLEEAAANNNTSSNNSLTKNKEKTFSEIEGNLNNPNNSNNNNNSNNDGATIKSQTSIISGQSVATTTSSGTTSDTDGLTSSPLPHDGDGKNLSNYVNIDYFLNKSKRKESRASGESEEDAEEPALLRAISIDEPVNANQDDYQESLEIVEMDSGVYGSSGDSNSAFSSNKGPSIQDTATLSVADQEKYAMFRFMLNNIAESESAYVEVLNVMLQYMKALKATLSTSKPVLTTDEFNIIFYKIPELYMLHQNFLQGLQQKAPKVSVGKHFENLVHDIGVYGAFLQNYSRAVDTVRKCSQNNENFAEITRNIRLRSLNKNQAVSLETLLYSPVSRVQKNIEIIQDLLKCLPESSPDYKSLKCALRDFQSFLSEFKMIQPEQLFHGQDRNPRHLVKNSFIVELSEGHRKLRHLFLFNDVLVCAKYKASGKDKFTFELKWYIPVGECAVIEESTEPREASSINLVALRSQASTVRDQLKRQTSREDPKKAKAEKQRKKLAELEAQLVLASPNLVFKVKSGNGRAYTFFLSSEYERSQWVDAVEVLKSSQPTTSSQHSMHELQLWLTSCRNHLKTNMGSYLLRTGRDEHLLIGDFYVLIGLLKGIQRPADLYVCIEVDSYGHFFRKAKTKMICESVQPCWNQDFVIELEGSQNLRILLYEDHPRQGTLIRAKTTIEINRSWLTNTMTERKIELQDYVLTISTKFIPSEMTIRRVPTGKPSGLFGAKVAQVCRREKRQVPFILTSCVREVEKRGINEVGIYRVSGSASDVSRLKKAFETNSYEAEQLLKEVDIHSVTGTLKLYLRELPEALFTDDLYPRFFDAFNLLDHELKRKNLLQFFSTLPPINQHIVIFLLEHFVRINSHENHNKMSLHNLATVFGPTLLRPGTKNESSGNSDLLAAGTVDVMAQAGILYFFLTRRATGEGHGLQTLPESS